MSTAGQAAARDSSAHDLVVELEDYRIQIGQIKRRCEALVEGLGNEAFNWKPEERRWSICECFGHLNITAELYLPLIDRALAKSRSQGLLGDAPARRGLIGGWIVADQRRRKREELGSPSLRPNVASRPPRCFVPKPAGLWTASSPSSSNSRTGLSNGYGKQTAWTYGVRRSARRLLPY